MSSSLPLVMPLVSGASPKRDAEPEAVRSELEEEIEIHIEEGDRGRQRRPALRVESDELARTASHACYMDHLHMHAAYTQSENETARTCIFMTQSDRWNNRTCTAQFNNLMSRRVPLANPGSEFQGLLNPRAIALASPESRVSPACPCMRMRISIRSIV